VIAPIMPFFAEELYQNLIVSIDTNAPESIHLTAFPETKPEFRNPKLETEVNLTRELISLGLSARKAAQIKVRQPLANGIISGLSDEEKKIVEKYGLIFEDELNIRNITFGEKDKTPAGNFVASIDEINMNKYRFYIDTTLTNELEQEGLARELVHKIQNLRKNSGFEVTDRIEIYYETTPKLDAAINAYCKYIGQEVLASKMSRLSEAKGADVKKSIEINKEMITISLKRVKKES